MFSSTFIFAKRQFDDEFHRLDEAIAAVARSTPGYLGEESWENRASGLVSNVYYWGSLEALQSLVKRYQAHAQVEEHAIDPIMTMRRHHLAKRGKTALVDAETRVAQARRPLAAGLNRLRIAIHRHQPALPAQPRQNRRAVAAPPEGAVDIDPVGTNRQRLDCLVEKDRHMPRLGHALGQP